MFLIIGCGYVGSQVADRLHAAGHRVVGVTHSVESAARLGGIKPYAVYAGDITQESFAQSPAVQACQDLAPTVLLCASTNRGGAEQAVRVYQEGSERLRRIFPASRLHFVSSTSVYPQTDGSTVTEESPCETEKTTARALQAGEATALATGGTAARLAGIYGPGRSFVLKAFLQGQAVIEGNEGHGRYLNQIHRDDAAQALQQLLLGAPSAIYNVVDDQPITQRECYEHLSERFHLPMPPVTPPNTTRKRAWTHKQVSNARLHQISWQPQYPCYLGALDHDPSLVPSILDQIASAA